MEVVILDNLVDDEWCKNIINDIDFRNNNNLRKPFVGSCGIFSDQYSNDKLTKEIYNKIISHPQLLPSMKESMTRPTDGVRTFLYIKGGETGIHQDGGDMNYRNLDHEYCKYKVLIYLNDDFKGGGTLFYDCNMIEWLTKSLTQLNTDHLKIKVRPKKGSCVIWNMETYHKGSKVKSGKKYAVGFEILAHKTLYHPTI